MHIDVHAHAWSDEYLGLLESAGRAGARILSGRGVGTTDEELESRLALMDETGIDVQVLSAGPALPFFVNGAAAAEAAQALNEEFKALIVRFPGRFAALATLPLPDVDSALAEIGRTLDEPGFCGVSLTTSLGGRPITDDAFAPLFDELDRRGSVVLLHPVGAAHDWPLVSGFGTDLTWLIGAPFEDTVAATQLVTSGFLLRYTQLKIVNSHLGGMLPLVLQRLENLARFQVPDLREPFGSTLRRMWYDSVSHAHLPALRCAVESFGVDQILFGTDYPYENGDVYRASVHEVGELGIQPAEAEAILGGNARALLGL